MQTLLIRKKEKLCKASKTSVAGHPPRKVNKIKPHKGDSESLDFFYAFSPKPIITPVLRTLVPDTCFVVSSNLQGVNLIDRCVFFRDKRGLTHLLPPE